MYDNFYEGYKDDAEIHPWRDEGAILTGKSFYQICAELRAILGLPDEIEEVPTGGADSYIGILGDVKIIPSYGYYKTGIGRQSATTTR
ncbi:hypothetical protein AGMMS50284_3500 [Clostridia bacterium]|nr:hypothetical protein AGMMS50284_3500 [Clostridia bacterium]